MARIEVSWKYACDLERVEGVAAGHLVDAKQRRSREDAIQALADDGLQRTHAERPDGHPLEGGFGKRRLEARSPAPLTDTAREKKVQGCTRPPQGECERVRRGAVEPLHVVDRKEEWPHFGEKLERASDRDAEGAGIEGLLRLLQEEGDLERMPARVAATLSCPSWGYPAITGM